MKTFHYLLAFAVLATPGITQAAPFAYIPNEKSGTISVIDCATDMVTNDIVTNGKPRGIAMQARRPAPVRQRPD
jgi:YVTN family beta-propeller protein